MKIAYQILLLHIIFLCFQSCDHNKTILHKINIKLDNEAKVNVSLLKKGEAIYDIHCAACHGIKGVGIGENFPPLANTDYVKQSTDKELHSIITNGLYGKIYVNNIEYNGAMPAMNLSYEERKSIIEYMRSLNND